jgi:hypothetical protein
MTIWEKIIEAQENKQNETTFIDNGQAVHIRVIQNGWYEGFVSMA